MAKLVKPDQDNQRPGKYIEVGPQGGKVHKPRVVTIDDQDTMPPTQQPGHCWKKL